MRFLVAEKLGPHKFKTPEGYLICTDAILSRTGKQEYKRCELFGDTCEDPDKIVNVERTDDEVFSDKAMASFENKAVCIEHPDHDVNAENHNELAVGFVRDIHKGEDNGKPVMMGTLVITDKDAVEAVESGEYKELSCGYDCDIDDDGEPCQRNIRGNHVALCKQGRAGIARIVDSVDDAGIKVWQVRQGYAIVVKRYWKQYGRNAFVDATESSIEAARYHRGSLERNDKMEFVIVDCNDGKYKIEDEGMKDIQATKTPGTDKIIYVMQSDIDKNLYFYIGKTFSMKEGAWGYTKFEMGDDTPEKIKAELARNGWHQVASGPARIIDASNEEWTVVEEENYEKANKAVIDEGYVQLPRGRFKVVEKTKEELKKEGYGYHHSANGYSVYVKNNNAVAIKDAVKDAEIDKLIEKYTNDPETTASLSGKKLIVELSERDERNTALINALKKAGFKQQSSFRFVKDSVKDSKEQLFTIEYEQDGVMHVRKVRASSIEDAISKVKSQDAGALPSSTWQHGSVYVNASSQITSQKIVSDIRDFMRSAGFAVCKIENGKVDELTISLKVSVVPSGKKGNAASFTFDLTYIPTSSYEHKYKSSSVSETQIATQLRKFANSKLYEDKSLE